MNEKKLPSAAQLAKSKTMRAAAVLAVLGAVEVNFHLVRDHIPADYQGLVFIAISCVMAYLRFKTSTPLSEK